jgi:hypothetical protein
MEERQRLRLPPLSPLRGVGGVHRIQIEKNQKKTGAISLEISRFLYLFVFAATVECPLFHSLDYCSQRYQLLSI